MKTLDKVIHEMEGHGVTYCCYPKKYDCPYHCKFDYADALHYLKEYRDLNENLKKEIAYYQETSDSLLRTVRKLEEAANEDNPPLSWNDIFAITGQPVWVECSEETHLKPFWGLVGRYTGHAIPFYTLAPIGEGCSIAYGHKNDMGINWIAYRKERL